LNNGNRSFSVRAQTAWYTAQNFTLLSFALSKIVQNKTKIKAEHDSTCNYKQSEHETATHLNPSIVTMVCDRGGEQVLTLRPLPVI
jgi:hypothetical protein